MSAIGGSRIRKGDGMGGSRTRKGDGRHIDHHHIDHHHIDHHHIDHHHIGHHHIGHHHIGHRPANVGYPYTFGYYYRPISYSNWVPVGTALNLETGEVALIYARQIDGGWWRYAIQTNYGRFTLLNSRNWNLEIGQMYYIQGETWRIIRL